MTLTKHPEGSLRELWSISFPLMLASFSVMLMIFVDRLFLAYYSGEALNAAVNASTLGWAFVIGWMVLGSISEVFVAQYNGAKEMHRLGEPVWQMIWFGLISIPFFIILGYFGPGWIYGVDPDYFMERDYFRWMMYFSWANVFYAALSGFFVGQGKTRAITILAFTANFINIILDSVLIFGLDGWIEPMGVKGAAISTSFSGVFQMIVLAIIFLNRKNRVNHNTADCSLKWDRMALCLKIGVPGAVFVMIEIFGWAVYYMMMEEAGIGYITIAGIAQSIIILFFFFGEGSGKAVTAIAGNYIGARKLNTIPKLLRAGLGLQLLFFLVIGALFGVFSDVVIDLFLPHASAAELAALQDPLITSIFLMIVYMLFEGFRFVLAGILTAAGDTMFLLIAGSLLMWVFLVIPVYFAVLVWGQSVVFACVLCAIYSFISSGIYYWRFMQEQWKLRSFVSDSE